MSTLAHLIAAATPDPAHHSPIACSEVGGVFLDADSYRRVIGILAVSRYQHYREVAAAAPTLEDSQRIIGAARRTTIDARSANDWVGGLGLEYLLAMRSGGGSGDG
ncbi:MAG: hypothetical protein QY307_07335 [Acidimicrobiia bacterium]|nr:MAG: hypothetical protein QY307_07335 [Acidimicrobiia bacterium]